MMQQEITLIRHTSVEHPRGFCYGNTDVDVSSNFQTEADWLQNKLGEFPPDIVYSSPLQRCTKLANHLFDHFLTDDRLKEINYGIWEGSTWEEIDVPENSNWIFHHPNKVIENGESFAIQQQRVVDFFNKIIDGKERRIAVVAHGGVIRSLMAHLLQIPLENTVHFKIHYAAQVKFIKENDRWRMNGIINS